MICKNCGNYLDEKAAFCPVCAEPIVISREKEGSPLSIASLVCGSLSLVFCVLAIILPFTLAPVADIFVWGYYIFSLSYFLLGISAIVCGSISIAKRKPKRADAVMGLVFGCVAFVMKIVLFWPMLIWVIYGVGLPF